MLISFLVFIFALFFVLGAYLGATRGSDAKRRRLRQRMNEALLHSAHNEDVEIVLARNELMSEIPWLAIIKANGLRSESGFAVLSPQPRSGAPGIRRYEISGGGVPICEIVERPRQMCSDLIHFTVAEPGNIHGERHLFRAAADLPDQLEMGVSLPMGETRLTSPATRGRFRLPAFIVPCALTTIGDLAHWCATQFTPPWGWNESEKFVAVEIEDNRRVTFIVE